jgi:adenylate kinase family enzyme
MRISIVGTSGSGKTRLAVALAEALGAPRIELDAVNWQAGWRDLNTHDPAEFARRTEAAVAAEDWVCDGNYSRVQPLVWGRATHVVWLDYSRSVVMRRVLRRSLSRALSGKELWEGTGNREDFRRWLNPEHPIRWAWDTHARNREKYAARLAAPEAAHLEVIRLRHPRDARTLIERAWDPLAAE